MSEPDHPGHPSRACPGRSSRRRARVAPSRVARAPCVARRITIPPSRISKVRARALARSLSLARAKRIDDRRGMNACMHDSMPRARARVSGDARASRSTSLCFHARVRLTMRRGTRARIARRRSFSNARSLGGRRRRRRGTGTRGVERGSERRVRCERTETRARVHRE